MSSQTLWTLCGVSLRPGELCRTELFPTDGYPIPATLVNGAFPGRTLLITAGVHSGEYPGVVSAIRLARELDPAEIHGRLILLPCVNRSGFYARSDALVPEDGGNLNAIFPGSPTGTCSERIAHWFVREILPQADFVADLHSGGMQEDLTSCLFYPGGSAVEAASLAAARATGIPLLVRSSNRRGIPGYASHVLNIPGLLLERGGMGRCDPDWVSSYLDDLRRLMLHLGLLPGAAAPSCEKTVFRNAVYLTSGETGLWYPAVEPGRQVEPGQLLGCTEDLFGETLHSYRAEAAGTVLYHTTALSVREGMPLVAYGLH